MSQLAVPGRVPPSRGPFIFNAEAPMKDGQTFVDGGLVAKDATGYFVRATAATGLTRPCIFSSDGSGSTKVAATGANGDVRAKVMFGLFKFANKAGDLVTVTTATAYIEDDQTVRATATGTSAAGPVWEVESDGVWVLLQFA